MKRLRFVTLLIILTVSCFPCYPWGGETHKLVTRLAIENLPEKLRNVYIDDLPKLEKMSNKPDAEARQHPQKRHEHYLDIEKLDPAYLRRLRYEMKNKSVVQLKPGSKKYQSFIKEFDIRYFSNRTFPYPEKQIKSLLDTLAPSLKEFEQKHRPGEISQIGTGLYQIQIYFDQLVQANNRNDRGSVIRSAGHLSHFVADMHQPFHTTANYKGQYTGNRTLPSGFNRNIHSRYETGLPRQYDAIVEREVRSRMRPARKLAPDKIIPAMIDKMRHGNKLTGKIIAADNVYFKKYPEEKINWTGYYDFMYEKVGDDMTKQIADAVNLLGDLVLTAASSADQRK
jgi:S1/P1 Nuclease